MNDILVDLVFFVNKNSGLGVVFFILCENVVWVCKFILVKMLLKLVIVCKW